jgi:hypothetical protein
MAVLLPIEKQKTEVLFVIIFSSPENPPLIDSTNSAQGIYEYQM